MTTKARIKFSRSSLSRLKPQDAPYFVMDKQGSGLRLRIAPTGVKSFQVSRRVGGKVVTKTIGRFCDKDGIILLSPEDAQKLAGQIYVECSEQNNPENKKQDITLGEFVKKYRKALKGVHKKPDETITRITKNFKGWLDNPLKEISLDMVLDWRADRLDDEVKCSTVNRDVNTLSGLLTNAFDRKYLQYHPLAGLKKFPVDDKDRKRFLSDIPEDDGGLSELERFKKALITREDKLRDQRASGNQWRASRGYELYPEYGEIVDYVRPFFLTALYTGARRGELFQLDWSYVDLERGLISLPKQICKAGGRDIPMNREIKEVLQKWRKQVGGYGLVFTSPKTGGQLTDIKKVWKSVLKEAKLDYPIGDKRYLRFHDIRHTFASLLMKRGAQLVRIQEFLGHKSIETTMIYAHLDPRLDGFSEVELLSSF